MKKTIWFPLTIFFILIGLTGCTKNQNELPPSSDQPLQTIDDSQTLFFWSETCPHCKNVEKYFEENGGLDERLKIKKIEISGNKENLKVFQQIAEKCKLSAMSAGVPLLYKEGKCTMGDTPIINLLDTMK